MLDDLTSNVTYFIRSRSRGVNLPAIYDADSRLDADCYCALLNRQVYEHGGEGMPDWQVMTAIDQERRAMPRADMKSFAFPADAVAEAMTL